MISNYILVSAIWSLVWAVAWKKSDWVNLLVKIAFTALGLWGVVAWLVMVGFVVAP